MKNQRIFVAMAIFLVASMFSFSFDGFNVKWLITAYPNLVIGLALSACLVGYLIVHTHQNKDERLQLYDLKRGLLPEKEKIIEEKKNQNV